MVLYPCTREAYKAAVSAAKLVEESAYLRLGHSLGEVEFAVEQQLLRNLAKELVHGLESRNGKHLFNILLGMREVFHNLELFTPPVFNHLP